MEGAGEGCGFFCSPKSPYLSTMSQQFCRRLQLQKSHSNYRACTNLELLPQSENKMAICNMSEIILIIYEVRMQNRIKNAKNSPFSHCPS